MRDYDRPNTPRTREFGRLVVPASTDAVSPTPGYDEFEGGHEVPRPIVADALDWFLGASEG